MIRSEFPLLARLDDWFTTANLASAVARTVVLELEWVLRSSFEFGNTDVLLTLSSLFSAAELSFESEQALEVALQLFRKDSADFADCFRVALATQANEQPLWTSDKGAAKISGAQLLAKAQVPHPNRTAALAWNDRRQSGPETTDDRRLLAET